MSKSKNTPKAEKVIDKTTPKKTGYEAAGKRFWKNRIHFPDLGTVSGLVTELQEDLFYAGSPDSDIMEWTSKKDLEAERKAEAKAEMRRRAGVAEDTD